jgi:mono/diheme cytochrome c family protein
LRIFLVILLLVTMTGGADAAGADVYKATCQICHQPDGNGVIAMYPALADSIGRFVRVPQGRAYLVHVVSFGLFGSISVHGQYFFGTMQPHPLLSDDDVAQVLNYVLTKFNSKLLPKTFKPFTAAEVRKYRAKPIPVTELYGDRQKLLKTLDRAGAGEHGR